MSGLALMGIRKLKVYEGNGPHSPILRIVLTGKWLKETGFPIGTQLNVDCQPDKIIITKKMEERQ